MNGIWVGERKRSYERKTTENQLLQTMPDGPPTTQKAYAVKVKQIFVQAGYVPFKAVKDYAGNCVYCGECGRCAGWHIYDGRGIA